MVKHTPKSFMVLGQIRQVAWVAGFLNATENMCETIASMFSSIHICVMQQLTAVIPFQFPKSYSHGSNHLPTYPADEISSRGLQRLWVNDTTTSPKGRAALESAGPYSYCRRQIVCIFAISRIYCSTRSSTFLPGSASEFACIPGHTVTRTHAVQCKRPFEHLPA